MEGWANEGEGALEVFGRQAAAKSAEEGVEWEDGRVGVRFSEEGDRS